MIAVIYDASNGRILQTVQGPPSSIQSDGRPFLEVEEPRIDYDAKFRVQDGQLVEIEE